MKIWARQGMAGHGRAGPGTARQGYHKTNTVTSAAVEAITERDHPKLTAHYLQNRASRVVPISGAVMRWKVRAKGNVRKALPRGQMNKLESEFASVLELRRLAGEILWWKYEAIKLRLTANDIAFLTPDFFAMLADGELVVYEVKGHWEDDALLKLKFAADQFPFRFVAVGKHPTRDGAGWWERAFGESGETT